MTAFHPGGIYTQYHVDRLAAQVEKYANYSLTVVEGELPGWWCKMDLFKVEGPCLYFDLDTTIIDDISPLIDIALNHRFVTLGNWNYPGRANTGVMAWNGDMSHLYAEFNPGDISQYPGGDQDWVHDHEAPIFFDELVPNMIRSYKLHVRKKGIPPECRVVAFHGNPRPWAIPELVKE